VSNDLIVLGLNAASDIPIGLEQGAIYELIGPDGWRAVLNNPGDPDHVGFLTEPPSGIGDGAEVRESADVIVEGDGGVHGNFYRGRRPWTMTGLIDTTVRPIDGNVEMVVVVNRRIQRLKRATRGLRADTTLRWSPQGGVPVELRARRQTSPRFTNRLPKAFTFGMVSAEWRILGQIVKSQAGAGAATLTCRNDGDVEADAVITLRNAWTNPVITNQQTGQAMSLTANGGLTMGAGDVLVIDTAAKTILLNGLNRYDRLAFPASSWIDVVAADNAMTATGVGAGGTWQVDWRDAWE